MNDRWIPDLNIASGVKYIAIADALDVAIDQGIVKPGDRLPPQRDLAARLNIDLTTVTRAYEAARLRGLIEGRGRAGSFVRDPARVEAPRRHMLDAGMNMPPELPRGILGRAIAQTTSELMARDAASFLQYQPAGGAREDRVSGAQLLARMGVPSSEDDVLIASGSQNALNAIVNSTFAPGDAIACGAHVYPGFRATAGRLGLRLVPLQQMDAESLRHACVNDTIKALYVVPFNDNPTAITLDAGDRKALAEVAEEHDIQIIEDDAYGALSPVLIAPIASYVPHRAWYIASTSKIISPALRVAFIRTPSIAAGLGLAAEVHETTIMAPPLNVAIVSAWIADGTFDLLVSKMQEESAKRQLIATELLGGFDTSSHAQGYHLWLRLPAHLKGRDIADLMRPSGISVIPAERFVVGEMACEAIRVSLGGAIAIDRLKGALLMLQGYIRGQASLSPLV